MKEEEQRIRKRLMELANRSYHSNRYEFTNFLNEMEQDMVLVAAQNFCHNFSFFLSQLFGIYFRKIHSKTESIFALRFFDILDKNNTTLQNPLLVHLQESHQ